MEQQLPLEKELRDLFAKFPAFPDGLTEFLVTVIPWFGLIGAFMGIMGFLTLIGVGSIISLATVGVSSYGSTWAMWVSILGLAVQAVIYIMAFQPLRARKIKGWNYLYYAFLLGMLVNIITFSFFGLIVGFLLGGWIIFQLRPKYS